MNTVRSQKLSVLILAAVFVVGLRPAEAQPPISPTSPVPPTSPAGDAPAALAHAQKLYHDRDFQGACQEYLRAIQLSAESVEPWVGLTRCHLQLGERAEAITSGRQARSLAKSPEDRARATGVLGSALLAGDEKEKAEALDLLRAERATGGTPANRELLRALLALGHDQEAADILREVRAGQSPGAASWRLLLCQAMPVFNPGDDAEVRKLNARLLAFDPAAPLVFGGRMGKPGWILPVPQPKLSRAERAKLLGTITWESVLEPDGKVREAVLQSEVPADLAEVLHRNLENCRFRPATLDGKGVPICYTVVWNLQNTKSVP